MRSLTVATVAHRFAQCSALKSDLLPADVRARRNSISPGKQSGYRSDSGRGERAGNTPVANPALCRGTPLHGEG